jgi:hypothetical protein
MLSAHVWSLLLVLTVFGVLTTRKPGHFYGYLSMLGGGTFWTAEAPDLYEDSNFLLTLHFLTTNVGLNIVLHHNCCQYPLSHVNRNGELRY